jgi:hypothetical protein
MPEGHRGKASLSPSGSENYKNQKPYSFGTTPNSQKLIRNKKKASYQFSLSFAYFFLTLKRFFLKISKQAKHKIISPSTK